METEYVFKIADTEAEYDLIARLNYETFVNEIPQHQENDAKMLQDKFHDENVYFICLRDKELMGMLSLRDVRPFSLDHKLPDLDQYFSPDLKMCEARLLSVQKDKRNGKITAHLLKMIGEYFLLGQYDLMLISGILNQQKLYAKMGFMPFGPLVGSGAATYQPMYLTQELARILLPGLVLNDLVTVPNQTCNYLPGPMEHEEQVRMGLAIKAVSHRGLDYKLLLDRVQWQLKQLTNAKHLQLFLGSGTLVNDVVAGQLSLLHEPGLIMHNGEFGNRLRANADGAGLNYKTFAANYGDDFDLDALDTFLQNDREIKWLWFVHLETSSGVLNDHRRILSIAGPYGVKVCADCISSLGNVPVDMSDFYLASSVAGKGLCSYTGVSMVFYNHRLAKPQTALPCYIDLWKYSQSDGIPFSGNSNLLRALHEALEYTDFNVRFSKISQVFHWTRDRLRKTALEIVNDGTSGNVVLSLKLPDSCFGLGEALEAAGYKTHFRSSFLRKNNILQITFMSPDALPPNPDLVNDIVRLVEISETCAKLQYRLAL